MVVDAICGIVTWVRSDRMAGFRSWAGRPSTGESSGEHSRPQSGHGCVWSQSLPLYGVSPVKSKVHSS